MPFRFPLASLLRLRQSFERQRAQRLQEASLAVARAQETISKIDQSLADTARSDENSLRVGRSSAELQFALAARATMLRQRQDLQVELERIKVARQAVAAEYQRAYREREVLETLATRQRQTYQQERLQQEQRELDASHLLQLWRKRLG